MCIWKGTRLAKTGNSQKCRLENLNNLRFKPCNQRIKNQTKSKIC